jgi:hypothetical protein
MNVFAIIFLSICSTVVLCGIVTIFKAKSVLTAHKSNFMGGK